jgi:hypothetical protein
LVINSTFFLLLANKKEKYDIFLLVFVKHTAARITTFLFECAIEQESKLMGVIVVPPIITSRTTQDTKC